MHERRDVPSQLLCQGSGDVRGTSTHDDLCRAEHKRRDPFSFQSVPEPENCDLQDAKSRLNDLVHTLDKCCTSTTNQSVKIVIYIDEAQELKNTCKSMDGFRTRLAILCSIFAGFCEQPLFCLLLSTQSSLRFLAPPGAAAPSERAKRRASKLLAPITETPFDCAPNFKIKPGALHVGELSDIRYLASWGRPL